MKISIAGCLILGAACFVLSGCGGKLGDVKGTVTLNGQPLKDATVSFQPDHEGRPSTGRTDEQGNYVLRYTPTQTGAEVGTHSVRISAPVTKKDRGGDDVIVGDQVPKQYNTATTLKKEVASGSQTIDFELKSDGKITPAPVENPKKKRVDSCE